MDDFVEEIEGFLERLGVMATTYHNDK